LGAVFIGIDLKTRRRTVSALANAHSSATIVGAKKIEGDAMASKKVSAAAAAPAGPPAVYEQDEEVFAYHGPLMYQAKVSAGGDRGAQGAADTDFACRGAATD
jgi:hypothetical protein